MPNTVRSMLRDKTAVHTVAPGDSILDALRRMAEHDIGAVLVLDGEAICGILSERDYARKVALAGKTSRETPVREIMTSDVITVDGGWTAEQCMALMTERRVRHLPVVEDGRLIGLISIGDVVRAVLSEQQFTISALEGYINTGG